MVGRTGEVRPLHSCPQGPPACGLGLFAKAQRRRKGEMNTLIHERIEKLRPKLLDLSRRNPLISTSLSPRSSSLIRVVDELPEVLAYHLRNQQAMRFFSLPPLDDDPKDEQS